MPQRARLLRRIVLAVLAVAGIAAFVPIPTAPLHPGPVWTRTATLHGQAPVSGSEHRGAPYSPIGLVLLDVFLGLDSGDPSGATADRVFLYPDEGTARAAAHEAILVGIRSGYAMQSAPIDQQVWSAGAGVWQDDGWDAPGKVHFTVVVMTPEAASAAEWSVHLLLEHTY